MRAMQLVPVLEVLLCLVLVPMLVLVLVLVVLVCLLLYLCVLEQVCVLELAHCRLLSSQHAAVVCVLNIVQFKATGPTFNGL